MKDDNIKNNDGQECLCSQIPALKMVVDQLKTEAANLREEIAAKDRKIQEMETEISQLREKLKGWWK